MALCVFKRLENSMESDSSFRSILGVSGSSGAEARALALDFRFGFAAAGAGAGASV
jgi:hypothetical protein